jgi:6-phosphogluconolactonase
MSSRRIRIAPFATIATQLAERIADDARNAIAARGRCTLALPGGSVANAVIPLLAQYDLPWERMHLLWCDERAVPLDDPDSNAGAAMRLWSGSPLAAAAHVHPMRGNAPDLDTEAQRYHELLVELAGSPPVLDVVLLGVGEDGHVASIFPGQAAETGAQRTPLLSVLVIREAAKAPPVRLTLSLPVLGRAHHVIMAAFGAGKQAIVQGLLTGSATTVPAAHLMREARDFTIMVDDAAGGRSLASGGWHDG